MAYQALVTVTHHHDSGLPQDDVVNTFAFASNGVNDELAGASPDIFAALNAFYDSVHSPGTTAIKGFLSELLNGQRTIKAYDRQDTPPRVPVAQDTETFTPASAGDPYPAEVALCLSFSAAQLSGSPPARRRGRVYIGPFNDTGSLQNGVGGPATGLINALAGAGAFLKSASFTDGTYWGVRSEPDNVTREIIGGWVDNAWDTQRRRGLDATGRTTW